MINLFPKIQDNQYRKQSWGGFLFISTIFLIIILILSEINHIKDGKISLNVDSSTDTRIKVNLDVIIQVPCTALSLNIWDMMGSYLHDVSHTIIKTRLINENLTQTNILYDKQFTSCYGAELLIDQKCYSCQDVMMAFSQRGFRQPNPQSIIQCVGQPNIPFDNSQIQEFIKQQDIILQDILETQNNLKNITPTELFKQSIEIDENDEDATEQIMTQEQRDKFKMTLGQLSEISYNPMQWDDQRLKQEKANKIDQLIGMLNISLDSIGGTLASQLRFSDRERVFPFKNLTSEYALLTEIYRQKCETTLNITLNVTYDGQETQKFNITMQQNNCSIPLYHKTNDNIMTIIIGENTINWTINTKIMMNQIIFQIEKLLVINEEYNYNYQPNSMLDKQYNWFRISVYVNVKQQKTNQRILFSEPFSVEQPNEQFIQLSDIEEHLEESCKFQGYFYIKKVPGIFSIQSNKQAMEMLNHTFNGNHSIHLSFGEKIINEQISTSDFSAKYYLKLVTTNIISTYGNEIQYKFTKQKQQGNASIYPSIEFQYEFDPISITIETNSIQSYIVIVFAVIGGVFAMSKYMAGIINMFM